VSTILVLFGFIWFNFAVILCAGPGYLCGHGPGFPFVSTILVLCVFIWFYFAVILCAGPGLPLRARPWFPLCEHRPGFICFHLVSFCRHFVRRSWLTFASTALVSLGFILPSFCAQVLAYLCEHGPGFPFVSTVLVLFVFTWFHFAVILCAGPGLPLRAPPWFHLVSFCRHFVRRSWLPLRARPWIPLCEHHPGFIWFHLV